MIRGSCERKPNHRSVIKIKKTRLFVTMQRGKGMVQYSCRLSQLVSFV